MALSLCSPTFVPCLTSPSPSFSFNNGKVFSLPSLVSAFHGIRLQNRSVKTAAPLSSRTGRARMLIRAAKREEEVNELRSKTTEELNEEVIDLKGELFVLRLQRSARQEFKSSEFRRMRKRIARILTIKREREIEQGIGKRLSRKLDKQWKKSIVVRPAPSLRKMLEKDNKDADAAKSS